MFVSMLRGKLHGAVVTDSQLEYSGSITIDGDLMAAAGILPHEKVLVANLSNGARFETYAIPAAPGSGVICLNGATTYKGAIGHRLIIFTFAMMTLDEAASHHPRVVMVNGANRPEPQAG